MATVTAKKVVIDAAGKSLGRIASYAAQCLRGKSEADYAPHVKPTCKVVIVNAGRVRVTGNKMAQEGRERYSGFHSGLRVLTYGELFKKDPSKFVAGAIAGMIPRNRLKKDILKNLTVYVGNEE